MMWLCCIYVVFEKMISDIEATLIARIYNVSCEDAKDGSWIDKYEEEE